MRRTPIVSLIALMAAASGGAQRREAPLAQVNVPHSYYWREMYVPQVTTGPSAFTWSPDGRDVVYSMQGSLWRPLLWQLPRFGKCGSQSVR